MTLGGPIAGATLGWIAAGAAALAVSAYIIKMRRRRFEVPFSQLWRRVLDQKDANALWKQLKRLISLLLILGILAVLLFAVLDPTSGGVSGRARSVVVLLDASASMKAMDGDDAGKKSRFEVAKAAAKKLVDGIGGGEAMIMKVDGQATPMSRFSSDTPMLDKVIDGVAPSDTPADLPRALGAAADALRDRPNPLIVIISDGAYPAVQLDQVRWGSDAGSGSAGSGSAGAGAGAGAGKNLAMIDLHGIEVSFVPVGKRSDNVGIIAFNVRRYIANKAAYEVYIEVQNFGQEVAHRKLSLYNGDTAVDVRDLTLKPGERTRQIYAKLPASDDNRLRAVLRPATDDGMEGSSGSDRGGKAALDPFPLDDQAFALLPARKKQKVLMVTEDNLFLEGALLVYDNADPRKVTPAEYAANPSVADDMDVVVFDDVTPETLPPPPASLIFFHPTGEHSPFKIHGEVDKPHITAIDEGHPVMRWITMSDVYMDKSDVFDLDPRRGETALATAIDSCVIAARRDGRRKMLAIGFSLPATGRDSATDLPMRVAFPLLLVNALDWFSGDQADLLTTYRTGSRERVPLDGVVGATEAEVRGPDGAITHTPVLDGLATFYGARVGYYDLTAKTPDGRAMATISLAANLASPTESNIAPSAELTLGGAKLGPPPAFPITHQQQLWLYFVLFAAGLIFVEWITYHRRITV